MPFCVSFIMPSGSVRFLFQDAGARGVDAHMAGDAAGQVHIGYPDAGELRLHLFLGGICFLASCLFSDTKYSVGFGAGIPALMYVLQMLANSGGKAENAKYFTAFTLYDANGIAAGESAALGGVLALLAGAAALYALGITVFCRKDLHI